MAAPSAILIFLFISAFAVVTVLLFVKMNEAEDIPYMDEIFHVPQAQMYCQGHFEQWDPMITTLPGLYLLTSGLYKPLTFLFDLDPLDVCSTFYLRGINVLFNLGNLYLIYKLYTKIHQADEVSTVKSVLESVAIVGFPVLYFYTFLYYTDPGAVFFVLLMYVLHCHGNNVLAAMLGALSVVFRQTNIVWMIFIGGRVLGKAFIEQLQLEKKEANTERLSDWSILKLTWQVIIRPALTSPSQMVFLILTILKNVWMFVVVGICFVIFVYLNEGLVVGDRSHHEACAHFPQLFYFFSVTLCFAFPLLISVHKVFDFVISTAKNPLPMIIFSGVAWFWVYKFTYVHDFLLADNRHYPFYVWSKIYRRHEFVRYALIPMYYYACWTFFQAVKTKDIFWKVTFFVCLFAATVPQKLLEFRYFIIPFIIFRLNMGPQALYKSFMVLILYILINGFTLYMYMYRPFRWENDDNLQRFLW